MANVSEKMVPQVIKLMLIHTKEDMDFKEMRESASKTLSMFCESCDKKVIDTITGAISYALSSKVVGERQASVPLFATLCDFSDEEYIEDCLKRGFETMFNLVKDD